MAGAQNSGRYFGAVELFPVVVLFYNNQRDSLYFFICGKTLMARITQSAAAYGIVIICGPGINDPGIVSAAKWTLHVRCSSPGFSFVQAAFRDFYRLSLTFPGMAVNEFLHIFFNFFHFRITVQTTR
jgi:hypothetical protein